MPHLPFGRPDQGLVGQRRPEPGFEEPGRMALVVQGRRRPADQVFELGTRQLAEHPPLDSLHFGGQLIGLQEDPLEG
jgi:hypothetical protein